jgi:hypothetical protein
MRGFSRGRSPGQVDVPFQPKRVGQLICALVVALIIMFMSFRGTNMPSLIEIAGLAAGPFLGYLFGYLFSGLNNFAVDSKESRIALLRINEGLDKKGKEGNFLIATCAFAGIYLIFYYAALLKFIPEDPAIDPGWPVNPLVVAITAMTVFALGLFSVRYAAYIRMTRLLEEAVRSSARPDLIQTLREAVFRGEQMFEPPGNLFTTIGITATFLGLAVGLVELNLPGLFGLGADEATNLVANNSAGTANTANFVTAASTANGAEAVLALRSFVGCMGLALGVSMLGVLNAMAAQWLRGHGAGEATEDLLERAGADRRRKPRKKAVSTAGRGTRKPPPAPETQPV